VHGQYHLTGSTIHIGDNLFDQSTHDHFFQAHVAILITPDSGKLLTKTQQIIVVVVGKWLPICGNLGQLPFSLVDFLNGTFPSFLQLRRNQSVIRIYGVVLPEGPVGFILRLFDR
jgi:hypothetical protein